MTLKLIKHHNQHGYGVSLTKYSDDGELVTGFVLKCFPTKDRRDKYLLELSELMGVEVEAEALGEH